VALCKGRQFFTATGTATMNSLVHVLEGAAERINAACEGEPAWRVVLVSSAGTLAAVYLAGVLWADDPLLVRAKKTALKLIRKIPAVRRKIEAEVKKVSHQLTEDMHEAVAGSAYITSLPPKGWSREDILKEVEAYRAFSKVDWSAGFVSGAVYNGNPELTDLMTTVYGMTAWTNPLHADLFPGVRKMEAEVVKMVADMFHGGADACGCMTSGGTESIILACKAYRDRAMARGVTRPEILVPITAHAAFDKAGMLMNIRVRHVPVDPDTQEVDIAAMKRMIGRRTCMLVGSAPQFPHGIFDPIEAISELGLRYDIPVHVDACLGGFLIPFMEEAGYPLPPFDFRLPGVSSISCDTHKYGFAPKGSSVVLYRNTELRRHQFFAQADWTGGIYATPSIAGSRAGGIIAACWAALVYYGRDGYVKTTKAILDTAKFLEKEIREIPALEVVGRPSVSVIAMRSPHFNVYHLGDAMAKRGWNLSATQYPACIHISLTLLHTSPGVAERLLADLKAVAAELRAAPPSSAEGSAALYGMAASLPDRSIVSEIAGLYIDATLATK